MDPSVRTALLTAGLLFVATFGAMTLYVVAKSGFDTYGDLLLAVFSLGVVIMILIGLVGAMRQPPRR